MTADELDTDAIRAREQAATEGPWATEPRLSYTSIRSSDDITRADAVREADAEFIAAARTDVPALLAEVDRLRALVDGDTGASA